MRRDRKIQMLSIIALVLAITGMTLGFAAFSSTLSISSSAIVTPNEDDFSIKIYGYNQKGDLGTLYEEQPESFTDLSYYSMTEAQPITFDVYSSGSVASIDNSTHTIDNIEVNLTEPDDGVFYFFYLKNEGKYDAYLDLTSFSSGFKKTCIPSDDVTLELFEAACEEIKISGQLFTDITNNDTFISLTESSSSFYKLKAGDFVVLWFDVGYYLDARADGDFSVVFDDVKLEFTTTPME